MRFASSIKILIVIVLVSTFFVGCFKDVSFNTSYVLVPLNQAETGDDNFTISGVTGYAFAVDTADWHVASYADALSGILTSDNNPAEKYSEPLAILEAYGVVDTIPDSKNWLRMNVDVSSVFILAVSTEQKLYGYRQQPIFENLKETFVEIVFMPWKEANFYVGEYDWLMFNEFYVPPPTTLCILKPTSQAEAGGAEVSASDIEAYAFAVDIADWEVTSYDNALAGILTSKSDPEVTYSETLVTMVSHGVIDGEPDSKNWLSAEIESRSSAFILVVNNQDKSYGYRQQDLTGGSEPAEQVVQLDIPVVFQTWREESSYIVEPWLMFSPEPTTLCILKPTSQAESGGAEVSASDIEAYAFAVDIADWEVTSYDNALAGILTSKSDTEVTYNKKLATMVPHEVVDGEPDSGNWLSAEIKSTSSAFILVVNTKDKSYGYRQQDLTDGEKQVEQLDIPIVFQTWREESSYIVEPWRMFSPEPEPDTPA